MSMTPPWPAGITVNACQLKVSFIRKRVSEHEASVVAAFRVWRYLAHRPVEANQDPVWMPCHAVDTFRVYRYGSWQLAAGLCLAHLHAPLSIRIDREDVVSRSDREYRMLLERTSPHHSQGDSIVDRRIDGDSSQVVLDSIPKVAEDLIDSVYRHADAAGLPPCHGGLLHPELLRQLSLRETSPLSQLLQHKSDLTSVAHNTRCYHGGRATEMASYRPDQRSHRVPKRRGCDFLGRVLAAGITPALWMT